VIVAQQCEPLDPIVPQQSVTKMGRPVPIVVKNTTDMDGPIRYSSLTLEHEEHLKIQIRVDSVM
jgi:hypothetical protein